MENTFTRNYGVSLACIFGNIEDQDTQYTYNEGERASALGLLGENTYYTGIGILFANNVAKAYGGAVVV